MKDQKFANSPYQNFSSNVMRGLPAVHERVPNLRARATDFHFSVPANAGGDDVCCKFRGNKETRKHKMAGGTVRKHKRAGSIPVRLVVILGLDHFE